MTKQIKLILDQSRFILVLRAEELVDQSGNFHEIVYMYDRVMVARIFQGAETKQITLKVYKNECPIQINWFFPKDQQVIQDFNIEANKCEISIFGTMFLAGACKIECKYFTLINDTTHGTMESKIDAISLSIIADWIRIYGIIGQHPRDGVSLLKHIRLVANDYMSIHGIVSAENAFAELQASAFRTTGYINVFALVAEFDKQIRIGSSAVIILKTTINLSTVSLIHLGFICCLAEMGESQFSSREFLSVLGEICVSDDMRVRLISQGKTVIAKRYLLPPFILDCPEALRQVEDVSGEQNLKKTFISKAHEDIHSYEKMLIASPNPNDVQQNRQALIERLKSAATDASETVNQDWLCDTYKSCLSDLGRSQTIYTRYIPWQE